MSFLVMLLALLLAHFTGLRRPLQQDGPLLSLLERLGRGAVRVARPPLAFLIVLLALLLPVALLLMLVPLTYGVLLVPLHVLILLWSFGRGAPLRELEALRTRWRRGDSEAASLQAEQSLGLRAGSDPALLQQVQGYLLWQGYQGFFAVIFYYALLGPLAALAYRLLDLLCMVPDSAGLRGSAVRLRQLLDGVPVRLLLLTLALAGNFVAAAPVLRRHLLDRQIDAPRLLAEGGRAAAELAGKSAAGQDPAAVHSLEALQNLLWRAGWIWASALALQVLLG